MTIENFISDFSEQFESTDKSEFTKDTYFKDLTEWSSLVALLELAMIEENYGVQVSAEEMRNSKTIQDLYIIIQSKQ